MPPFFKDFGKPAKDLLDQNYNFDDHKLELKAATQDATFNVEWSAKAASKIETEYKLPKSTALTIECLSDSKITATLKLKDVTPGATVKAKAATTNKAFVGVEYVNGLGSFTGEVDHDLVKQSSVVTVSGLVGQNNFLLGGSLQILPHAGVAAAYVLGGGYEEKGQYELTAKLTENLEKRVPPQLLVQYIRYARPDLTYAARFTRSLEESPKTSLELGTVYAASSATKVGAKLNNSAQLGVYALHKINNSISLTQSYQLDVKDQAAPHRLGVGIKFTA
eukprot:c17520_g1_i1.p1 GENE.c17520_g1_i1~~c17520_g1_i1.p1  ORF type:complete len:278 (-),score=93.96 c17520_g1_i1:192-1025(-)